MSNDERVSRKREIDLFDRWRAEHERRRGAVLSRFFGEDGGEADWSNVGSILAHAESRSRLIDALGALDREKADLERLVVRAQIEHMFSTSGRRARRDLGVRA